MSRVSSTDIKNTLDIITPQGMRQTGKGYTRNIMPMSSTLMMDIFLLHKDPLHAYLLLITAF